MAYDINAVLERLENDLSEVESAKKQVEETIATSESLQQIIGRYTETLNAMSNDISAFIEEVHNYHDMKVYELGSAADALKTSCECVSTKFNEDVKDAIEGFDGKFTEAIEKFGSENEKLQIQVHKLNSLQDSLNKATEKVKEVENKVDILATELKNSQDEQDNMLTSVKSSLEALSPSIKSQAETIVSEVNRHTLDLESISNEISEKVSTSIQKLENHISVLTETKVICNGIKAELENLKGSVDSQFASIKSAININRWIAIIGILALIALHFIKL